MYQSANIVSRWALCMSLTAMTVFCFPVYSAEANQDPAQSAPVIDKQEDSAEYVYQDRGRRDPFTPLIRKEDPVPEIQPQRRPEQLRGPLEQFELRQLRLIAVLVVQGAPRAMVAAPDGKSYTVKVDDYIGLNGGRVKDIQTRLVKVDESGMRVEAHPDRIVIEETGIDSQSGRTVKEDRYIVL